MWVKKNKKLRINSKKEEEEKSIMGTQKKRLGLFGGSSAMEARCEELSGGNDWWDQTPKEI